MATENECIVQHDGSTRRIVFIEHQEREVLLEPRLVEAAGVTSWVLHIGDEAFEISSPSEPVVVTRVSA